MKLHSLFFSAMLFTGAQLFAAPILFTANLNAANENPPTQSAGTGVAKVTIDTVAHTMEVNVIFQGLTSGVTASHIHCCVAPGGNAGVATTTPTFAGFPSGVTSGSYDRILDTSLASTYNPAFVTANSGSVASAEAALFAGIAAGNAYLNIHTTNFGGGEIRGFLVAAPEPATLGLVGLTLAVLLGFRRRIHL